MNIKVGDEYLDFDGEIFIEKSVRLFEEISIVNGDFSYQFDVPLTANNERLLINNDVWRNNIPCQLLNNQGEIIEYGFLKVQEYSTVISLSFFGSNSDLLSILNFDILGYAGFLPFNVRASLTNIQDSWNSDSGVVWPLCDNGTIDDRVKIDLVNNDFHPYIYVHSAVNYILSTTGIKIEGELLNDPLYKKIITSNANNKVAGLEATLIENETVKVGLLANQSIPDDGTRLVEFDNINPPYNQSVNTNWNTTSNRYEVTNPLRKLKVRVLIDVSESVDEGQVFITVNGLVENFQTGFFNVAPGNPIIYEYVIDRILEIGDYIDVRVALLLNNPLDYPVEITTDSFIQVTPVLYDIVFIDKILPNIKASEFIADVFKLFNVLAKFDSINKTIHTIIFDNIKQKEPIDISDYINESTIIRDYDSFLSSFAKKNFLNYEESSSELVEQYNNENKLEFGCGVLNIDSDSVELEGDFFNVNFVGTVLKFIPKLSGYLSFNIYREFEDRGSRSDITSVTNNGGFARFNTGNQFEAGSLIRVDTSREDYNGIHRATAVNINYFDTDFPYLGDATGDCIEQNIVVADNDDQCVLVYEKDLPVSDFSTQAITLNGSALTNVGYAYFHIPETGLPISENYSVTLAFDPVDLNGLKTLKTLYYRNTERILNFGYFIRVEAFLDLKTFKEIDFLRPLLIVSKKDYGLYYCNRITGYEESFKPCEIELIKIS